MKTCLNRFYHFSDDQGNTVETKSDNAARVLQLMDSVEDGLAEYSRFVAQTSEETGTNIKKIEKELEPFI
jgi:hypothetical protein